MVTLHKKIKIGRNRQPTPAQPAGGGSITAQATLHNTNASRIYSLDALGDPVGSGFCGLVEMYPNIRRNAAPVNCSVYAPEGGS